MRLLNLGDADWRETVGRFKDLSYQQGLSYAQCAAATNGAKVEVVGLTQDASLSAAAVVRVLKSRMLPFGLAYVHYGPLTVTRGGTFDPRFYLEAVRALQEHYAVGRGLVLRVAPPLIFGDDAEVVRRGLSDLGFAESRAERRRTILVPLQSDGERMFGALGSKWRSTLRKAQRTAVTVEERRDDAAFAAFDAMLAQLQERKGFRSPQDVGFFRKAMAQASAGEVYRLVVAKEGETIIAGHLGSYIGDMCVYLLGAANERGRELNSSYLLHWHVLNRSIEDGLSWYDLGGVDPVRNAAGYTFKKAMKGLEISEIGAFDFVPGIRQAVLLKAAEWMREVRSGRRQPLADLTRLLHRRAGR